MGIIAPEIFKKLESLFFDIIKKKLNEEPSYIKKIDNNTTVLHLPNEQWQAFLNKIYKEFPGLDRGKKSGLWELK